LVNIPGLLQTEEYMRAQFVATGERLENAVGARLFRQKRIVDAGRLGLQAEVAPVLDLVPLHQPGRLAARARSSRSGS
jgi:hypothetical protein